ncbi:hypothetical protein EDB85DRAFT_1998169 [Lactarius pseudohatsudake]|nr:hypothetical protein EDB85DRAFT_1998169 [Lactarius pseudohatsudake]
MACTDSPVSPSFPRMSEMFLNVIIPPCAILLPNAPHLLLSRARDCPSSLVSQSASASPRNSRSIARSSSPPPLPMHGRVASWRTVPRGTRYDAPAVRLFAQARPVLSNLLELAPALRSMRALLALTRPAFDAELLAMALGALMHLTPLTDTPPYTSFDDFLAAPASVHLTHLALLHFVGVPSAVHDVPPTASPRRARQ